MLMFVVSYAKTTARTAQAAKRRSRVVRLREARRLLDQRGRILTLELTGGWVGGRRPIHFRMLRCCYTLTQRRLVRFSSCFDDDTARSHNDDKTIFQTRRHLLRLLRHHL